MTLLSLSVYARAVCTHGTVPALWRHKCCIKMPKPLTEVDGAKSRDAEHGGKGRVGGGLYPTHKKFMPSLPKLFKRK